MPYQDEPYLYRPIMRPICNPMDIVALLTQGGVYKCIRVRHIEARPKTTHDFGSTLNGNTVTAVQAQNSNSQDILAVAANQFLQTRFQLDPRDWLTSPTTPAQMYVYQPGSATQRWNNLYQAAWADAVYQADYGVAMTELFSWYTDTPQFGVSNTSGSTMANTRVNFFGIVYTGDDVGENPSDPDLMSQAKDTPAGRILLVPASVANVAKVANAPVF